MQIKDEIKQDDHPETDSTPDSLPFIHVVDQSLAKLGEYACSIRIGRYRRWVAGRSHKGKWLVSIKVSGYLP